MDISALTKLADPSALLSAGSSQSSSSALPLPDPTELLSGAASGDMDTSGLGDAANLLSAATEDSALGDVGSTVGGVAGTAVGGPLGAIAGSAIGKLAGNLFGNLLGG